MNLEDQRTTIMVGASFEEIEAAAKSAVKNEIDAQVQQVVPQLAKTLEDATICLKQATTLIKRYRRTIYTLTFVAALEGGYIVAQLVLHR